MYYMRFIGIACFLFIFFSVNLAAQDSIINYSLTVHFDSDKSELTADARQKLRQLSSNLSKHKIKEIRLKGHTDSIGSHNYNVALSQRRVKAVAEYFKAQGFKAIINTEWAGETEPVKNNGEESGRAENRRVDITAIAVVNIPKPSGEPEVIKGLLIRGVVTDAESVEPISAATVILELSEGNMEYITKTDGNYRFQLKDKQYFKISARATGYIYQTKEIELKTLMADTIIIDFALEKIRKGKKFVAENIYFYPNLPEVVPTSIPEMNKLLRMMRENPTVKIEIQGHVNWPSTYLTPIDEKTIRLSEDRARTVYAYLIDNGISASRMRFIGKGNTEMVIPDAVDMEEFRKNMRVEIMILEE